MVVVLTEEGIADMRQAVMNTLNSFNQGRGCPNCGNIGMREEVEFIQTSQFFHIQIASRGGKRCIPLQDFEITLSSGIVKKYELECIIQRSGNNAYNGHYWSNIKKWHMV